MWNRSLVTRLMMPVAIMLALVCLLGAVSVASRARLRGAYDDLQRDQHIRADLVEIRSLSRSLQRDVLNLATEPDRKEMGLLSGKFTSRSTDMYARLADLESDLRLIGGTERGDYFATQRTVLDRLAAAAAVARRGERTRALTIFRATVRPNERRASQVADAMIAEREREVARLLIRTRDLEEWEFAVRVISSIALFLMAAVVTLLIVTRTVVRPLSDIERAMDLIAAGETGGSTPHIDRPDEIGRMARAIEVFRASVLEREALRADSARAGTEEIRRELEREQRQRHTDAQAAERSRAVADSARALRRDVGEVLEGLRASAGQLSSTAVELAGHASSAARGTDEVEAAVVRAADGATDIAAATDQFMTALADAGERTRRAATLSAHAAEQSATLATCMARVREDADTVAAAGTLINAVAQRTNLLALNATIEAARAGEAGRGFAVVAGEVKALAAQSAQATDDIARRIAGVQRTAREAEEALNGIASIIADMAQAANTIAGSVGEQTASGQVISRNVTGAANDLDVIGKELGIVSAAAGGVDGLAGQVRSDANRVRHSAETIDRALVDFFDQLDAA
jgi:methyl-accepting chemotaxis protein